MRDWYMEAEKALQRGDLSPARAVSDGLCLAVAVMIRAAARERWSEAETRRRYLLLAEDAFAKCAAEVGPLMDINAEPAPGAARG